MNQPDQAGPPPTNMMKILPAALTLLLLKGAATQECPAPTELTNSETLPTAGGNTITIKHAIVLSSVSESLSLLCAQIESDTEGYIAFGISPDGTMDGGEAIIGKPDDAEIDPGTVMKYTLQRKEEGAPWAMLMPDEKQTLMLTRFTQEDGSTTMEFAKYLEEPGEHSILASGSNTFLYVLGTGSDLRYPEADRRGVFTLDFETTRPPSLSSTTLAPTFGGSGNSEIASSGFTRTLSPTGGAIRRDPVPSPNPTSSPSAGGAVRGDPVTSPNPTSSPSKQSTPEATTPDVPSGATTRNNICTIIFGAGAVVVWFGM